MKMSGILVEMHFIGVLLMFFLGSPDMAGILSYALSVGCFFICSYI